VTGRDSDLKKILTTRGSAITLCHVTGLPRGASWGEDGTIVFATSEGSQGLRADAASWA
jgi:hypothetical protein